nr:unnamed protein product [Callosobruchus analis]
MQPGWLPERLDLGASLINIANLFNELIESVETSDGKNIEELFSDENFLTVISDKIERKLGLKATKQKMVELEKEVVDLRRSKNKPECDIEMLVNTKEIT